MRNSAFRSCGVGIVFLVTVFGFSTMARASLFEASNVDVRVSGGQVAAFNQCVNDARDGIIQTQINACQQLAQANNILELDDVAVDVINDSSPDERPLYENDNADIRLSGGAARAANQCVNDAQDGFLQVQANQCVQFSIVNNVLILKNVNIIVL